METTDVLRRRGLRAYEVGRWRWAARVAWVVVPLAALSAWASGAVEACWCIGAVLAACALGLRWANRRGAESATVGLLAGALPLVGGLVLGRVWPGCAGAPLVSWCTAVCLGFGLPAGVWLGRRAVRGGLGVGGTVLAAGVAALAGSLGCVALGAAGVVGTALGLGLGSVLVRVRAA